MTGADLTELFKVNYEADRITLSARNVHEFLEVKTQYTKWFQRMCEYGFDENIDYRAISQKRLTAQGNETAYVDHEISLDMAKEISMLQRNEKGKEARQYFLELERRWNSPEYVMERALNYAKLRIQELEGENKLLSDSNKKYKDFFSKLFSKSRELTIEESAKVLNYRKVGRNKLYQILRDRKVLMQNNLPYQKYINYGYFRVVEEFSIRRHDGKDCLNLKTLVYQKGLYYIDQILMREGYIHGERVDE